MLKKGDKSFWKPYFDILPDADIPALWSDEELKELQDPEFAREAHDYKEDLLEQWKQTKKVLKKYPEIFPKDKVTKELFLFVYVNVVTRCFGWSIPCTMMIPVADIMNHAPINTGNEMFNPDLHEKAVDYWLNKTEGKKEMIKENSKEILFVKQYGMKSKMALDFSEYRKTLIKNMNPTCEEIKEPHRTVINKLEVEDDIVEICKDMEKLNLKDKDYNIWNVYFFNMKF